MKKIAVVLLSMGGPDSLEAVQPFLFNLFQDPAIIRVPQPFRSLIARLISVLRARPAREIYAKLGGRSPLLKNTQDQANALERTLNEASSDPIFKVFIAMRYWHPFAAETMQLMKKFTPEEVILLPLYPQYSTTTTQSSVDEWQRTAQSEGLDISTRTIFCYPQEKGFIRSLAEATRRAYNEAKEFGNPRILFSAHGLPEKIIEAGDPYPVHCALTVDALRRELAIDILDSVLCFQSRVGPMKWVGPSTDYEVQRAGKDKVPLVIAPIAFVSEHSETLVEIEIEYRKLAKLSGVPFFARVPAVGISPDFINSLAQIIRDVRTSEKDGLCAMEEQICLSKNTTCFCGKKV